MGGDLQRMKIYQTFEPVPSRVLGLLRLLRHSDQRGVPRDTVIDLLQPKSLREKEHADTLATNTIAAVMELSTNEIRIIEQQDDGKGKLLVLGKHLRECDDSQFDDRARALLELAALRPKVGNSANRFAEVCAWLLCLPPVSMPQGHAELKTRMQSDGLSYNEFGLNNDARWDMIVYWAKYFGLLWQWQDERCRGLVPDPTEYTKRHLTELLPLKKQVPIQEFQQNLGRLCPVLDGGIVHDSVASKLAQKGVYQNQRERLSPAFSFAIRNLQEEGILHYWCPDDQRVFHLMSGDEKIAFLTREKEVN